MKRCIFILTIVLLAAIGTAVTALEVDEGEVRDVEASGISFTNYQGPYERIDTYQEIYDIGEALAQGLTESGGEQAFYGKYRVIRSVDPQAENRMDADIFIIEEEAQVDHIRNLRTILAGYLAASFDYEENEALLLAEFVTLYNAVHRGDMDFFSTRYTSDVNSYLNADNAGLATNYEQWAGSTRMLIPLRRRLTEDGTSQDTPDSIELTDEDVVSELQEREDRGLEERKEMSEFQDEELAEEEEALETQEEAVEEGRQQREDEQQALEEEEAELAEARETAEERGDQEEIEQIDQRTEEVEQRQRELEEQEEEAEQTQQQLDETREELEDRQKAIEESREEIARDQQEELEEEEPAEQAVPEEDSGRTVYLYRLREGVHPPEGRLTKNRFDSARQIAEADDLVLYGRTLHFLSNGILVVGSESNRNTSRLYLLDTASLQIKENSATTVYASGQVLFDRGIVYAVVDDGGEWKLGSFDEQLQRISVSSEQVHPDTLIRKLDDGRILVQKRGGGFLVFSPRNLDLMDSLP
ncbi:MAG: hypothetical protein K9L68_01750 [Spirochaetales bacterium]|nr:hypothetical protein [Spirochaetales bacterium]MCF7937301.1 hypothetical protein [Spirochaetales bacterium]